jgi:spermidine synthase
MPSPKRNPKISKKDTSKPESTAPLPSNGRVSLSDQWRGSYWLLGTVFFFSGLCGLIYEVLWSRWLTLIFGNTTYAISTVVGVFMFGLALGSYGCGRILTRIKNPLRAYALVEMGIGVYAALFIPLLSGVQGIHSILFPFIYEHTLILNITRILLSFGLLLIPTSLMGATLPLLGQSITHSPALVGRDIGILYALNTFGAAAGSFSSAFLLIPALGILPTVLFGAVLNMLIGLAVWALFKGEEGEGMKSPTRMLNLPPNSNTTERLRPYIFFLFIFMGSGCLALIYEVAWSRALILVFGTSIYAFATILTTYLIGIALGSLLMGRWTDRVKNPVLPFALFQMAIGIFVFATTIVIGKLPDFFLNIFSRSDLSWETITLIEFGVCFLVIIGPTFASGACFPLVTRLFVNYRGFKVGQTVADAYTFNTLGGIFGSLASGFLFIPLLGVERSLLLGGGTNLLIVSLLSIFLPGLKGPTKFVWRVAPVLGGIAGIIFLPSWNPKVLNSGVYVYANIMANNMESTDVNSFMADYKLLFHKEGASATVTVFEEANTRFLRVNGKTDGGNSSDNYTQIFLGLLPVMYCKNPEKALVIGLGTGITLGSVLDYPVTQVDCVEISPEVVEASHFFDEDNGHVLSSPRVRLHLLDGRTWLMAIPQTYDLITAEPSHPWQTGNANLFTVDFFRLAVKRLNEEGVFCQWLPMYHMDKEHFRLLVSSFKKVFPYVHIWMTTTDALLIGSRQKLTTVDYVELQRRMAMSKIRERLAKVEIHSPEDFLSFFYLDNEAVVKFIKGTRGVNSDNNPVLEFSAPKYLLKKTKPDTFFSFLTLSYESKLPLVNAKDIVGIQQKRLNSRAAYFRQWRIPEVIIQQMLLQR